uniref:Uncharacterized protein n=1 Tax=Salmonella phage vB_STmST313_KE31 TaxID=3161181 RepID=A0AAU8GMB1_9CAUD
MMKNFAQELQTTIDQAQIWEAMGIVEKAVDIFVCKMKKQLVSQANRGVEIDDMVYAVGGNRFDEILTAFQQAYKSQKYPTDKQVEKFKTLLVARLLKEGLKFELHKDERTDVVTMRFTVHTNDI